MFESQADNPKEDCVDNGGTEVCNCPADLIFAVDKKTCIGEKTAHYVIFDQEYKKLYRYWNKFELFCYMITCFPLKKYHVVDYFVWCQILCHYASLTVLSLIL